MASIDSALTISQGGCRVVTGWSQGVYRVVAGWSQSGYRVVAGYPAKWQGRLMLSAGF